jgi:hypothetical protein
MVIRIEQMLEQIVGALASERPVLLLVLDGLSFAVWREIGANLSGQGWHEIIPVGSSGIRPVIAGLPTITEVCRAGLLTGTLVRGNAGSEKTGFAAHPVLRGKSHSAKPPVLFHKADLGTGLELNDAVRSALADHGQKVVGIVHNAVDAQLAGSDQIDFDWSAEVLRQVSSYFRIAHDVGRALVVTGDHGHVMEDGTAQRSADGGDRWRSAGSVAPGEVELRGGRVRGASGSQSVIMAWSERVRYSSKRNGYHGGASPQEVVVPVAVLVGDATPHDWVVKLSVGRSGRQPGLIVCLSLLPT